MEKKLLLTTDIVQPRQRSFSLQLAEHRTILLIVDGLLVNISLLASLWLGAQRSDWFFSWGLILAYSPWFISVTIVYFVLATVNDAYQPRVAFDPAASFVAIGKIILQIFILILVVFFLSPPLSFPRHFIGFFTVIAPCMLLGWRRIYSWAFTIPVFKQKAIIVGAGWAGKTIAKTIQELAPSYFEIVGFVDDDAAKKHQIIQGLPVIGDTEMLPALVQVKRATEVVLAINRDVPGHVLASLMRCYEKNIRISYMSELYERLTSKVPVEHIDENWHVILPLNNKGQNISFRAIKRCCDIVISVIGLILFIPLLPFLIVLITTDSPGPVFYRQKRVGRGGKEFELIKLRSMVEDAEKDGEAKWAEVGDIRVTRVGRFLRQTRLDEVPQLLNVLSGEMSLIGPRPERPEFVTKLQEEIPFYRTRLTVKPGLTGWAQVNYDYGRNTVDALEKLRYDLYYIKHQSLTLDMVIFFKTIGTILRLKGT